MFSGMYVAFTCAAKFFLTYVTGEGNVMNKTSITITVQHLFTSISAFSAESKLNILTEGVIKD